MRHATRIALLIAALVVPATGLATSGEKKADDAPPKTPIVKANGAITIDGTLDDADWKRADAVPVHWVYPKKDVKHETPLMTARYLWDDRYLYIGYEIHDANLVAKATGREQGPEGNKRMGAEIWVDPPATQVDLAEFFIVFESDQMFWEIHQDAAGRFNDVLVIMDLESWKKHPPAMARSRIYFAKEEYIADDGEYTFAQAVALMPKKDGKPSTVNVEDDTDTGFSGEIRIPWKSAGAPQAAASTIIIEPAKKGKRAVTEPGPWKMAGRTVRILAAYQSGDTKDRYFVSVPRTTPQFFAQQVPSYPVYEFVETE